LSPSFAKEIEHQLNTPFTQAERFSPFRFFVVPEVGSFCLGLAYFHAMADAECILFLLKEMVDSYRGKGSPGFANPVDHHPPRQDHLLRLPPGVLAGKLVALPSHIRGMRSACRPRYRDAQDMTNKCALFSLNPQTLSGMIQAAKSLNVTLNDLLLTLLMRAVSLLTPDRARAPRRRGISLGCIVNIRKDLGMTGEQAFGLFLGAFVVHHEVPAGMNLADLEEKWLVYLKLRVSWIPIMTSVTTLWFIAALIFVYGYARKKRQAGKRLQEMAKEEESEEWHPNG
jgi:NRPS condensation-like uncharacterized protein